MERQNRREKFLRVGAETKALLAVRLGQQSRVQSAFLQQSPAQARLASESLSSEVKAGETRFLLRHPGMWQSWRTRPILLVAEDVGILAHDVGAEMGLEIESPRFRRRCRCR
jgi:hypothetical protein